MHVMWPSEQSPDLVPCLEALSLPPPPAHVPSSFGPLLTGHLTPVTMATPSANTTALLPPGCHSPRPCAVRVSHSLGHLPHQDCIH